MSKREAGFHIKMTAEERDWVALAARLQGRSTSDFARETLVSRARVLIDYFQGSKDFETIDYNSTAVMKKQVEYMDALKSGKVEYGPMQVWRYEEEED